MEVEVSAGGLEGNREQALVGVFPREYLTLGENLLVEIKPKRIAFLIGSLFTTALLVVPLLALGFLSARSSNTALVTLGIFAVPLGLALGVGAVTNYLRWRGTFYAVTDRRIISVTGIVGRSIIDVPHDKVQNVTAYQGPLQKWLGYGSIIFATAGIGSGTAARHPGLIAGNLLFVGIAQPFDVRQRVEQIVQASDQQAKLKEYRAMAETFREVGTEPLPTPAVRAPTVVFAPTERKPAKFCEFCGAPVEGMPQYCDRCGNRIN